MSKFFNHVNLIIMLIMVQTNAQDICGSQSYGESEMEARQKATASLAQAINSSVSYNSKTEETIDGIESKQKDTTIQQISSKLLNANAARYTYCESLYDYCFKACMSAKNAAKPYLDLSMEQAGKLKNEVLALGGKLGKKEAWDNIVIIYKKLKDLENVLTSLEQMDMDLKRKYEADYAEAEKKYKLFVSQSNKGVYVESSNSHFKSRISSYIADEGCFLAEEPETAVLHLKLDVKDCELQNDKNTFFCRACITMNLGDNKSGKNIYEDFITGPKEGWTDKDKACKNAMEASVAGTWNKLKGKINKGGCK